MFQHYLNADRVTQYQQQCQHEATIERGLAAGRAVQLGIPQIAMAGAVRFFAATGLHRPLPHPADIK